MSLDHSFPDPIQGAIELPLWLVNVKDEPAIRRMLFIRQLGLKAYIDFPGAIHTRFSHALGTMQLAERMVIMLSSKMRDKGNKVISKNLEDNKNNMMAAGFLHDIGHGPFSHVLDFVLRKIYGKSHEDIAKDVITDLPSEIEDWGITKNSVVQLIKGEHKHPFLGEIINGPIDVDKLDYLLRDAYHVGLKYSFDLNYFLRSYSVLGDEKDIERCILGLDCTKRAIVTAELFIVIWKSMYDLVYHVDSSRIAEKMLEKAILLSRHEPSIKEVLKIDRFLELTDESLLTLMESEGSQVEHLLAAREPQRLYKKILEVELEQEEFEMCPEFHEMMERDQDELSDKLSLRLNTLLGIEEYTFICDIVRSKSPTEIYLDEISKENQETELRKKSDLVGAIRATNVLKVYANPKVKDLISKINNNIKKLVEGEESLV